MQDLIQGLPEWVQMLPAIFLGLVVIATVVVRFTKSEKDDKIVGKIAGYVLWVLERFPTFGLNPHTKKLKDAYEKLKGEQSNDKAPDSDS